MTDDKDTPLTDAEKAFLLEHAGFPADSFDPERMAEDRAKIAAMIERAKYVLPTRGPWGLPEVIEALPAMAHSELVALLNAPLDELSEATPIEWLRVDGSAHIVMEALLGLSIQQVAERAARTYRQCACRSGSSRQTNTSTAGDLSTSSDCEGRQRCSQHSAQKNKDSSNDHRTLARGTLCALARPDRAHSREPADP